MTERHLDDEQLSAALDVGDLGETDAHLAGCAECRDRAAALAEAAAVLSAGVPPLPPEVVDRLVAKAIALADPVRRPAVVDLAERRRTQPRPLAWVVGLAAVVALVVGIGAVVRLGTSESSMNFATEGADERGSGEAAQETSADSGGNAATTVPDPETVRADLGDHSDLQGLSAALAMPRATAAPLADAAAEGPAPAGGTSASADRARCVGTAASYPSGDLGRLESTATLRWRGEPAEALVFTLRAPADGFTRRALVLRRADCALLADPRF